MYEKLRRNEGIQRKKERKKERKIITFLELFLTEVKKVTLVIGSYR